MMITQHIKIAASYRVTESIGIVGIIADPPHRQHMPEIIGPQP